MDKKSKKEKLTTSSVPKQSAIQVRTRTGVFNVIWHFKWTKWEIFNNFSLGAVDKNGKKI